MTEHTGTITIGVIVIQAETNIASGMSRDGGGTNASPVRGKCRDSVTEYVTNWSFVTTCVT